MIIVTGSVHARPEAVDEAVTLSLVHVRRSRQEPGCVAHSVHRDVEDPNHLVFLERWTDVDALRAHVAVPASRRFVRALSALAEGNPEMTVFSAEVASL